jgi:hypothetical protein
VGRQVTSEERTNSCHWFLVASLYCGFLLAGQTTLRAQSIEGIWTRTAFSNSCDVYGPDTLFERGVPIVRRGPNTFSFGDADTAALDPQATAAAAARIVGTGPGKYTYSYHLAETPTTTETVIEWTLTLANSDTLQIDGWEQEFATGNVLPRCIVHYTLRRSSGTSSFPSGGAGTDSASCSSWGDCAQTAGYIATMASAAGLLGWGLSLLGGGMADDLADFAYAGPYVSGGDSTASGSPYSPPGSSPTPSIGWDPNWVQNTYGTLPTESQIEEQQAQQLDLSAGKHIDPATGGEVDDAPENSGGEDLFPDE